MPRPADFSVALSHRRLHKAKEPSTAHKNQVPSKTFRSTEDQLPAFANSEVNSPPRRTPTGIQYRKKRKAGNTTSVSTNMTKILAIPDHTG
jgi:hypothetical protein